MPKLKTNQSGFVNLIILGLLAIGIVLAVYLVGQQTIWRSNAALSGPISGPNPSMLPSSKPSTDIIVDSFTRPNATSLGKADSGQSWSTYNASFSISNNQAVVSSRCPAPGYAFIDAGMSNGTLDVTFPQNHQDARLLLRYIDQSNYYTLERDGFGYIVDLYQKELRTNLARYNTPVSNGDQIKVSLSATNIVVYINGTQRLKVQGPQASSVAGTKFGFGTWCDNSMSFDNFKFSSLIYSPTPSPIPTASVSCNTTPKSFSTYISCDNGNNRIAYFTCQDGFTNIIGDVTSCKSNADWQKVVNQTCLTHSVCK